MAEPNDPISTMVERLDETVMTPELTIEEQVEVAIPGSLRPKEMDGSVIEVLTEEDGSAVVDFDPQPENMIDEGDFYRNLAEELDDTALGLLVSDLTSQYENDNNSRKDWRENYEKGLERGAHGAFPWSQRRNPSDIGRGGYPVSGTGVQRVASP